MNAASITFRLTPDVGEPYEVRASGRDIYVWETRYPDKTVSGLWARLAMVDLYTLAHTAAQRQGLFTGSLNDFVTTHEIDFDTDESAADPFPPAPSPIPASSSPSPRGSRRTSGPKKGSGR